MKRTQSATNIADKTKRDIYISSRQLIQIETNLLSKGLNCSITSKTLPKNDIATVKTTVKDLEKEEADTIRFCFLYRHVHIFTNFTNLQQ